MYRFLCDKFGMHLPSVLKLIRISFNDMLSEILDWLSVCLDSTLYSQTLNVLLYDHFHEV